MRNRFAVLALALAMALTACGAEASDDDQVRETARTFLDAVAEDDVGTGCVQLNTSGTVWVSTVAGLNTEGGLPPGTSCPPNFAALAEVDGADELANADIRDVSVRGDAAFVAVSSKLMPGLKLEREGDEWLIADGYNPPSAAGWALSVRAASTRPSATCPSHQRM